MLVVRGGNYLITSQKVLSREEQARIIRACRRPGPEEPWSCKARNGLMIMLALECGLRACEVLDLRIRDFNDSERSLFIRSKKGSNARELPLRGLRSRDLKKWILAHFNAKKLASIDPDARIFPVGYHCFQKSWDYVRPHRRKGLHSLRHSFAVNLYERTQNIKVVQLALGHRNIQNTMVYMDFFYSQTALRRLMHGPVTPEMGRAPVAIPEPLAL